MAWRSFFRFLTDGGLLVVATKKRRPVAAQESTLFWGSPDSRRVTHRQDIVCSSHGDWRRIKDDSRFAGWNVVSFPTCIIAVAPQRATPRVKKQLDILASCLLGANRRD